MLTFFPGVPHDELRKEMERLKAYDFDVKDGKAFAYVYTTDDEKFKLQKLAHELFSGKSVIPAFIFSVNRSILPYVFSHNKT